MRMAKNHSMQTKRKDGRLTNKPLPEYYNQHSERLVFRAFTLDDIEPWIPFFDHDEYMSFLAQDITIPGKERAETWIKRQIQRQREEESYGQLAVIEKTTNKFVGVGGIIAREIDEVGEYEITYSIKKEFWGKGYATELALHFLNFVQHKIPHHTAMSIIHVDNDASKAVAKKNDLIFDRLHSFMGMEVELWRKNFN